MVSFLATQKWLLLHEVLGRHPRLFSFVYALHPKVRPLLVNAKTDLVIEGFPRSANTYAVVAFLQAQSEEVSLAHHTHVRAQVMRAIELQKPILIIIRDPIEAVSSQVIRHPCVSWTVYMRTYIRYYKYIETALNSLVLVDFRHVIEDFGYVIRKLNDRYHRGFDLFSDDPASVDRVFESIDNINARLAASQKNKLGRPDPGKEVLKRHIKSKIMQERLLLQAETIYRSLVAQIT